MRRNAQAPLVTFVSASGGSGKTAVSLAAAWLAAAAGTRTALVEADLQFGALGFWLGLDDEIPNLAQGKDCVPITISKNLDVYKAPCFPEVAEDVSDAVADFVPKIREDANLVIADTGQFWSGLTGALVCSSDFVVLVCDARPSSLSATVKAQELLSRMRVPRTRCICACNRWSSHAGLKPAQVKAALGDDAVFFISDGKAAVEARLSRGDLEALQEEGNPLFLGADDLLCTLMPRCGKTYASQFAHKRGRCFR